MNRVECHGLAIAGLPSRVDCDGELKHQFVSNDFTLCGVEIKERIKSGKPAPEDHSQIIQGHIGRNQNMEEILAGDGV
jgi:hypothetical protein